MALGAAQQGQEELQRASFLNAARNRKVQQEVRKNLIPERKYTDKDDDVPEESQQKSRLALLKAGAIKQANAKAGGAVGATVGGTVGSVIPIIGTGIGAFVGRFIGKKAGITGIIIFVILSMLFSFIMFIAILKGACETNAGKSTNNAAWIASFGTTDICSSFK